MSGPPIPVLIRRSRKERGLSQRALAEAAGVSQAVISYYENGRATPSTDVLQRIGGILGLPRGVLEDSLGRVRTASDTGISVAEPSRSVLLRTVETAGRVAVFDRPANHDGGDLAFAVDLRSHVFLVLIDAEGSGPASAQLARMAAACVFGATVIPGGGVPTPEDVVDTTLRFWKFCGESPRSAALCVVALEHQTRRMHQCRLGMSAPFLRDGRLAQWTGKPDGPAGSFVGTREIGDGALLVLATDGVAHLPTKGERTLWESPELRTRLMRAADPQEVIDMFEKRAATAEARERADDRLAIAVMP
jgi:transcriptional regulator with XRE-family HTH domain